MKTNSRIKYYCGVPVEVMTSNFSIFESEKATKETKKSSGRKVKPDELPEADFKAVRDSKVGRRRAVKRVFDLVACNPELDVFCTFTLDKRAIDRYDYKTIVKKLNNWLDNHVRRNGLKYVLVAEYHKDRAIHFHALMNRSLTLVDSGKRDSGGHKVYNLPQWTLGFTTAIECYGDRAAVCKYITKYITKAEEKVGGRWFYHGGELEEPVFAYLNLKVSGGEPETVVPVGLADKVVSTYTFIPDDPFIEGLKFYISKLKGGF